jgi:hypothetical protein
MILRNVFTGQSRWIPAFAGMTKRRIHINSFDTILAVNGWVFHWVLLRFRRLQKNRKPPFGGSCFTPGFRPGSMSGMTLRPE